MTRRFGPFFATLAAALLLVAATGGGPARAFELTRAQTLLFDTDHLHGLARDTRLSYRFEKAGTQEPGFADTVEMTVEGVGEDGRKDLSFHFLSGDHAMPFDPVSRFNGNPLIMLFLERDAREMKRLTGGSELFFRNRLRNAFAATAAEVTDTTVSWQGRTVPATEVVVRPYVKVELIERFPAFEYKEYRFVLSDAVPGTLYSARTVTPAAGPDATAAAAPRMAESMVIAGAEAPRQQAATTPEATPEAAPGGTAAAATRTEGQP